MPIQVGDRAPNIKTSEFSLAMLKGKRVVLFFFPKADTPGCTKESCEFRDASEDFAKKNAEIVGISPDKAEAQAKFADKYGLPYTFVPDPGSRDRRSLRRVEGKEHVRAQVHGHRADHVRDRPEGQDRQDVREGQARRARRGGAGGFGEVTALRVSFRRQCTQFTGLKRCTRRP